MNKHEKPSREPDYVRFGEIEDHCWSYWWPELIMGYKGIYGELCFKLYMKESDIPNHQRHLYTSWSIIESQPLRIQEALDRWLAEQIAGDKP